MSVDLYLEAGETLCFDVNFTYNFGPMWHKACPDHKKTVQVEGLSGREAEPFFVQVILAVTQDPEGFKDLEPANKWGTAEVFLWKAVECRKACELHPDAVWRAHR